MVLPGGLTHNLILRKNIGSTFHAALEFWANQNATTARVENKQHLK